MAPRDGLLHPDYKPEPYWWEAVRPGTDHSVDPPARTEIAVIGGGYAGLACALELARSGRRVAVLEAEQFGIGASSRNGGGVSAGVNLGKGMSGTPGMSKAAADREALLERLTVESKASLELVEELVTREAIDCSFEKKGRFLAAYTPKHFEAMPARIERMNRLTGAGAYLLPRERQREEIGSDFYHGGTVIPLAGKLHPALFHRGLLEAAHRAGATLSADARVEDIQGGLGRFRLSTTRGPVEAEQVVVATNGYTGPISPDLRKRIVPVRSHIIATEELPEELTRRLIPNGRTISETPRVLHYYRISPDGRRVIFGGRSRFTEVTSETSARLLHRAMTARWPELADARVTHSWSGVVAFTLDKLPHLGREAGMHWCTGCNGSGVGMLTYLGHTVAKGIAAGGTSGSAYEGLPFPALPFYSGSPWFLPVVGGWYRFLDRVDRRFGPR